MAKYVFLVYENEAAYEAELKEINHGELQSLDSFTIKIGGYYELIRYLANKFPISEEDVTHVSIYDKKKDIEFSIISQNEYLKKLLSEINDEKKEITTSRQYREMKEYLFENLQSPNYMEFLNSVYTYKNKFRDLLSRYAMVYHQGMYSEEERINELRLKDEISKKLSVYKNYRGLSICRAKSEGARQPVIVKPNPVENLTVSPTMCNQSSNVRLQYSTIEAQTDRYNQEYEEFLEPDEFEMMQGEPESDENGYPKRYQ